MREKETEKRTDVGSFLRLLAHDLQNQLGAIDLNLQVIPSLVCADDPTLLTINPFLSRASLAATDLNDMLVDLQSFARLISETDDQGASAPSSELTKLDLSGKVRECGLALGSAAKARGIDLEVRPGQNVFARGAADNVRQALKILVRDALSGSFPGSIVTVETLSAPTPVIDITSTQEGLFEENRVTLASFLAKRLLEASNVSLEYPQTIKNSTLRLIWKVGQL